MLLDLLSSIIHDAPDNISATLDAISYNFDTDS